MEKHEAEPTGLSRRTFIQGAAAVAATTALAGGSLYGCSSQEGGEAEAGGEVTTEIFAGACRSNCTGGCFLNIHVRDGKIVRTTARDLPNPEYNRICTRGIMHPARTYSAERVQYPMRRVGERGQGEFERISWDEAIDEIVEKWSGYTEEYGPESMAMLRGTGNYAIMGGAWSIGAAGHRFMNVVGCSNIGYNTDFAHVRAYRMITGSSLTGSNNEPADFKNSKTFVCWGANPSVSHPQVMHFILEAQDAGTKFIVIDPAFNTNAAKADWHIPVNTSTDGALAFGVLNEIFAQGWQNLEFLRAHTEAPFLIKEDGSLLRMSDLGVEPTKGDIDATTGQPTTIDPFAIWDEQQNKAVAVGEAQMPALENIPEINGIKVTTEYELLKEKIAEYPLEYVTQITGVPVESIKELARVYAQEGPVNTYAQYGNNHYINGHYNYWPIYAVSLVTGNVGKPGAACGFMALLPLIANFAGTLFPVDSEGNPAQGQGIEYTMNSISDVLDTNTYVGKPVNLKGVFITNSNLLSTWSEREKTKYWLNKIDFIIVADSVMTETAMYADILLPICHWFETTDLFTTYGSTPYLLWQEQAIEPLYESKSDWNVYQILSERLGYGEFFDMTEEDYISLWLDSDSLKAVGATFDRLKEEKAVSMLPEEPFISYKDGSFATTSGRARFYQEKVVPDYDLGQTYDEAKEKTLYWEPALEADVNSPIRQTHIFSVFSEHMRTRTHSQWWDVGYLKEFETGPLVKINPQDAAEYGIVDGDKVRLYNERGSVVMKAVIQPALPSRMLACPRSFQAQEFIEGHFANITTSQFNQVCANQSFNDVAVSIEKA